MDELYFRLKNDVKRVTSNFRLYLSPKKKTILKENRKFFAKFCGQRCFVVGNGPSLKKQDLSKLKNEVVFTVNMLPKSPLFAQVQSNFHVMVDPFIFQIDMRKSEDREKMHILEKINMPPNYPTCFFPYAAKLEIERQGIHRYLNISYLEMGYQIYDDYKKEFDLTKCCPGFSNVVQYAIMIAIYMGFKEIYLIGCDMTGYEQISVLAGKEIELHAYGMNADEKKTIQNTHTQMKPETFFKGFYTMFADYRRLYKYTMERGVSLYNATVGGVLDSIPRVNYNELFK